MTQLALSAIGRDRPGIVAEVTRALLGHSLNITDSQMAVLGGRFTMMLIVDAPDGDRPRRRPRGARAHARAARARRAVAEPARRRRAGAPRAAPSHIVTVYGVDHPGIVHAVSARLAARAVNVTDLETRLVGDGLLRDGARGRAARSTLDPEALAAMLAEVGAEQGVEVTVRPLEPDVM